MPLSGNYQFVSNTPTADVANAPVVGASDYNANVLAAIAKNPAGTVTASGAARPAQSIPGAEVGVQLQTPLVTNANKKTQDMRVRIQVPTLYQSAVYTSGAGGNLKSLNSIIFPYTPQISFEHKADYATENPIHSNYSINFYKSSYVGDISIQGVFTVQNTTDAVTYLSTVHLLRALTKGRFGGSDNLAGSPPPICRLHAYGTFMLDSVPIAIQSFKIDLPNDVDYFYLNDPSFLEASVPTKSTIILQCKPMYSRQEMLDNTVSGWIGSPAQRQKGLL